MDAIVSGLIGAIIASFGILGIIAVLVFLNPEKVEIWLSLFYRAARLVVKKAEYKAVAYDVGGHLNEHFATQLEDQLDGYSAPKISLRWTNDAETVANESEGTLIVRMQPEDEREANILRASLAATPKMIAPTIRPDLQEIQSKAIDLQLCRRLAERLGRSAETRYRLEILEEALESYPPLEKILRRFHALDEGGLFIPVLLQELIKASALSRSERLRSFSDEFKNFVEFLYTIASRDPGENVELSFLGRYIQVNILLVAETKKRSGPVRPYQGRVGLELAKGVDTIYMMGTEPNLKFIERIRKALEGDRRVFQRKKRRLLINRYGDHEKAVIIPYERNEGYSSAENFATLVEDAGLGVGQRTTALVTSVEPGYVLLNMYDMQGVIEDRELSWQYVDDCRKFVEIGDEIDVEITDVDPQKAEIRASRRLCLENPLESIEENSLKGSVLPMTVTGFVQSRGSGTRYLAGSAELEDGTLVSARMSEDQIEWGGAEDAIRRYSEGDTVEGVVYRVDRPAGLVVMSRKKLSGDRWQEIRAQYSEGQSLEVRIDSLDGRGAFCTVEPGLAGFVPRKEFEIAGHEYRDFQGRFSEGDTLYTYVRNIVAGKKQRMTLGLEVNRD